MEHAVRPSEFLGRWNPLESIDAAHLSRLQTSLSGSQPDFTRAVSEVAKHSPQDDGGFFQAVVSSAHCRHTFAALTKHIMEYVFPSSDDLGRRAFWLLSMHAVISIEGGSISDYRVGHESRDHRPDLSSITSRHGSTIKNTVGDVYDVLRSINGRFVKATGGLGLEDAVVFEAWNCLNGSARCDPLFNLHLKLEEQKAKPTSQLSLDEASRLAVVSADLERLFESMELTVKGKTPGIPAPSNKAIKTGLPASDYSQSSKKTRRATLASSSIALPPVSTSSFPTESRPSSGPIIPSSPPRRRRAASMSQTQRVSFVVPLPGISTEINHGAYPAQTLRASHDTAPNQNKTHRFSTPTWGSRMAAASDSALGLDGVNQPDKVPPTSGTGHRTLRRREKGSISIVDGRIRYPNSNDMIPVAPGLQTASQVSHAATRRFSASSAPGGGEIAPPGRTADGHEIRYYDSCMVVGPHSAVVPYLSDDSDGVPGTLMQHRPYPGKH